MCVLTVIRIVYSNFYLMLYPNLKYEDPAFFKKKTTNADEIKDLNYKLEKNGYEIILKSPNFVEDCYIGKNNEMNKKKKIHNDFRDFDGCQWGNCWYFNIFIWRWNKY